jgi:hypothetical protein
MGNEATTLRQHPLADILIALAEGKPVQWRHKKGCKLWNDFSSTPRGIKLWDDCEYRIKPETKKYRVSLHTMSGRTFLFISEEDDIAAVREDADSFVRWISDWVEYEAT